jgi:opacity protein-like surface antigen
MKKNVSLLLISCFFLRAVDTQAQEWCAEDLCYYEDKCCDASTNFYAKILSGANFLQNTRADRNKSRYQTGYLISGYLGYYWQCGLYVEGEYAYRINEIRKIHFFGQGDSRHGHFQSSSYMANLLWDLPLSSWGCLFDNLRAFVGAGIGYDFQRMHSSNSCIIFKQKWKHFSWQLMTGLAYSVFCNTEISLEYKFHQGSCHFNHHSLGVGLTYKFGLW